MPARPMSPVFRAWVVMRVPTTPFDSHLRRPLDLIPARERIENVAGIDHTLHPADAQPRDLSATNDKV